MKTLHWKQSQILSDFSSCENLQDLIDAIEEKCLQSSLLVCAIKVNGMGLEEEDESRFANTSIKEVNELEVEVGNIYEIIKGILTSYASWIPYLKEVAEDVADSLRAGNMDVAQRAINEMADALTDLVSSLGELKKTRSTIPTLVGLENIDKLELTFLKVTKELSEAFEKSDFVLAADVAEYDLNNLLDDLKSWVELNQQGYANKGIINEPTSGNGEVTP